MQMIWQECTWNQLELEDLITSMQIMLMLAPFLIFALSYI